MLPYLASGIPFTILKVYKSLPYFPAMPEFPCQHCGKVFGSEAARDMHAKAKHAVREKGKGLTPQAKKQIKRYLIWGMVLLAVLGLGYWFYSTTRNYEGAYTKGDVHWHADLKMSICGAFRDLPRVGIGEHHKGLPLLHTHDDNVIHVEGQIFKKEDVSLGTFMDAIGVPFSETELLDKKNGDACPDGSVGKVQMFLNGQPSTQFRNYITKDGDKVELRFG